MTEQDAPRSAGRAAGRDDRRPVTHVLLQGSAVCLVVAVAVVCAVLLVRTGVVDRVVDIARAYLDWLTALPGRL